MGNCLTSCCDCCECEERPEPNREYEGKGHRPKGDGAKRHRIRDAHCTRDDTTYYRTETSSPSIRTYNPYRPYDRETRIAGQGNSRVQHPSDTYSNYRPPAYNPYA